MAMTKQARHSRYGSEIVEACKALDVQKAHLTTLRATHRDLDEAHKPLFDQAQLKPKEEEYRAALRELKDLVGRQGMVAHLKALMYNLLPYEDDTPCRYQGAWPVEAGGKKVL